jgi:hypothetical protein
MLEKRIRQEQRDTKDHNEKLLKQFAETKPKMNELDRCILKILLSKNANLSNLIGSFTN